MIKKIMILILALGVLSGCLKKEMMYKLEGEVNGIVIDSFQNPIKEAKIILANKTTYTDSNGYFEIKNIPIAGNPKYQIYVERNGYTSKIEEIKFESSINLDGSSRGDDSIPINDSVTSLKITLENMIDLKGEFVFPQGLKIDGKSKVLLDGELKINPNYKGDLSLVKLRGEIDSNLKFTLKNIPRYGVFEGGDGKSYRIIEELRLTLYIDDMLNPKYTYILKDFDLTKYPVENINEKFIADIGRVELERYHYISGKVYINMDELSKPEDERETVEGAVVLLKSNGEEITRTITDMNGVYTFEKVEPGIDYQLSLLNHDSNQDGNYEYRAREDFEIFRIEKMNTIDKVINLWYEKSGVYSIEGIVYAGEKENIPIPYASVALYSSGGLIKEVKADEFGNFKFSNIANKEIYLISYDFDSDQNGYINFFGYKQGDSAIDKTKIPLNNVNLVDIKGVQLHMKVNKNEPNYTLELKSGNFFNVNSKNQIYNQTTLSTGEDIVFEFNKELDKTTINSLIERKKNIVTIVNLASSEEIDTNLYLDVSNTKRLVIEVKAVLTEGTYRLNFDKEINALEPYRYGVGNNIQDSVLNALTLTIKNSPTVTPLP